MKKQKMLNRVSSLILAVVMVLGLCVSPVATKNAQAGENDDLAGSLKIVATEDNLTFEEGKVGDLSSYFTLECDGLTCLWGPSNKYFYAPYTEIFTLSYAKVEKDGSETALSAAPSEAGSYKVYAKATEEHYYAYAGQSTLGYFYSEDIPAASISYTIGEGVSVDVSDDVDKSSLKLLYGDENLADKDAFILLMFGDGFTESEQDKFYKESKDIADYVMTTAPYDEFTDVIKIYAYGTVSNESGARADKANTQAEADKDTRDTYFGSTFWTGGMQRLLSIDDAGIAKADALAKQVLPEADFNVILVNSDTYGGSGGEVCVCSLNYLSTEMMIHELGHTVANLSDEYWAGASYAAENVNMSQESDPEKVRWARFIGKNGISVYKHNQTETSDWYRPSENCKMQYLSPDSPFCEVCKEALRQAFCKNSNITKLFFQTYADDFCESEEGTDMSQYFIIRRGDKEVTGDQLGSKLKLVYKDAEGNVVEGIPSKKGTYTVEATYAGDSTFEACKATGTYTIELDLINLDVEALKEYDGKAPKISYTVDYDKEYTETVKYTGQQYGGVNNITYDSTTCPSKPGKYTITVSVYDKESGELLTEKSAYFQISYKVTRMIDNNTATYPGAQDWYNNKQIVIVGEGFTKSQQSKFEKVAKEYAEYILNLEPYKEVQTYFNFSTVETISEVSGSGTSAKNTFFQLRYDKNGKIIAENANSISQIGYNNVSQYRTATIVIVNDSKIKAGNTSNGVFYGGLNTASKTYVAKELLNMLTNHKVGYRATTTSAKAKQRTELLNALYYTWYGEDFAVITGNAYSKEFIAGKKVSMTGCFKTYILGKQVSTSKLKYKYTYYKNGKKLSSAPSTAGTYTVVAELVPTQEVGYNAQYEIFEITSDLKLVEVYEEGYGTYLEYQDANGNTVGWPNDTKYTVVKMDGRSYLVPRARGTSTFTIVSAATAKKQFQTKKNNLSSVKSASKKALTANWTTVSNADGYEVQYSTSSSFKGAKTATVAGSAKKTTTIKKLTSGKKYYVRVRAYSKIGGKKVYSKWSTKKSVSVK